jgi:hypothetical protein
LAAHGQIATVAQPPIAADIHQAPDIGLHLAPQVTLDSIFAVNHLTQRSNF